MNEHTHTQLPNRKRVKEAEYRENEDKQTKAGWSRYIKTRARTLHDFHIVKEGQVMSCGGKSSDDDDDDRSKKYHCERMSVCELYAMCMEVESGGELGWFKQKQMLKTKAEP